jgi:hypothetical protein
LQHASGVIEDEVDANFRGQGDLLVASGKNPDRAGNLGNISRVVNCPSYLERPRNLKGGNLRPGIAGALGPGRFA